MTDFVKYIQSLVDTEKREKAKIWQAAIGLQGVDGLKVSEYLLQVAKQHIEGEISIKQARYLIDSYYDSKSNH